MNKRLQQRLSTEIAESEGDTLCLQVRRGDADEAQAYLEQFNREASLILTGLPLSRPMHLETASKNPIQVLEGPFIDLDRHLGAWIEVKLLNYEPEPGKHLAPKELKGLIRRTVKGEPGYFSIRKEDTTLTVPAGLTLILRAVTHREATGMSTQALSAIHQHDRKKTLELMVNKEMSVWEFMCQLRFQLSSDPTSLKN